MENHAAGVKVKQDKKTKKVVIGFVTVVIIIMGIMIMLHHNQLANPMEELLKKIGACFILIVGFSIFLRLYDKIVILPMELYQNRRLIWKLSKNDFKTRYAGSYLGMFWAFVQPVVTITLYWMVFEVLIPSRGQYAGSGIETPYVLWLTAGLVPWFFFSEAINNGTTALLEYSYLVKKVVFKISILPIIKIVAACFIHIFFVGVMLIIYVCYGNPIDLYLLQIIYYSFSMFIFVLALSYTTCAIVIFFRDLTQIISIFLQVGMWATPILWNIAILPKEFQIFFKLNPIYYVVNGYRSAMFEKGWFWEDFFSTMYFWIVTAVLFGIGALIFKRLKVHFADVL
ncbi:MAG TPA: ABC transporter permease [Lachnospiraceae bacterium]|nr:ABC transporter permease [Lachnospiraceae bacterium]